MVSKKDVVISEKLLAVNAGPEEEYRQSAIRRLKSLEGQMRGLQRMLEERRYCVDILTQIAASQEALRQVARLVLRKYLEDCATRGIKSGDPEQMKEIYDEIMDVFFKYSK